ncbi:PspC domain-containing protein [Dysosmobacter sp.]|jgi:phage shock protein C, pspC|uniref:PspC domain-containing protein n=1 Tax=Dysosmobacter sp. TaxID=2591382 RepID=UPI003AB3D706
MEGKKLYKSNTDKKIAGVCGGIAEYFNIDATLVRLGWVVFSLLGGSGLLAYIIAAIIMPERPY